MPFHCFSYELHISYGNLSQLIWSFSLEIYFWNSQKQLHSKFLRLTEKKYRPSSLCGRIWFMLVFFIFCSRFLSLTNLLKRHLTVYSILNFCFFTCGQKNAKIRTHTNKVPHGIWISNINFVISSNLPSAGFALEELQIALATENQ